MDKLLQCKKDQKGTEAKDQLKIQKDFQKKGSENPLRVASFSEAPTSGFRSSGLAPTLARYALRFRPEGTSKAEAAFPERHTIHH